MSRRKNNIYLIGFSGSGKTTIGDLLAKKLHAEFIDTDEVIVKQTKQEIAVIFAEKGEKYFRSLEEEIIQKVSHHNSFKKVISLGGGVFQNSANRKFISQHGISIYLSCSQKELYRRLKNKTDRPLLQNKSTIIKVTSAELRNKIRLMMQKRIINYKKADVTVSTSTKTKREIVNQIQKRLKNYAGH